MFFYGKMNYEKNDTKVITKEEKDKYMEEEKDDSLENIDESKENEINDVVNENFKDAVELNFNDGVFNILLIGTDEREGVGGSRSDSMILVSINEDTKEITLTSFLRDTYVSIKGHENNRLNAAYAFGGTDLLKDTIQNNFKIPIDRYVKVDFFSFMEIVDIIGGIDMELTEKEVDVLNDYLGEVNTILGEEGSDRIDGGAGIYHLNGKQTLAYSRNRRDVDGDFSRTNRQRKILVAIKDKVKECNLIQLYDMFNTALPYITTDMTKGEFLTLLMDFTNYLNADINTNHVPYDGTFENVNINKMAVLSVDFKKNIDYLKRDIYGIDIIE